MRDIHYFSGRLGNEMFRHAYLYAQVKEGHLPDVYLQDPKYFEKYQDEIRSLFGEGIDSLPYTAIHLRVGANPTNFEEPKYSDNPFYIDLSKTDYYDRAIKLFPNDKFLVFSDDMDFAGAYFTGGRFIFDESKTDLDSFNRMASCQNFIIANSSWSWWGAYLSTVFDKKIIAPSVDKWYTSGQELTKCPPEWIRI
mgnify:CR=1 FL=1